MGTINYLVRLTPYDKFFFGSEHTFGQKTNDNDISETNYLVKSNYFPQQTGLLGFIRHQLLIQAGSSVFDNNRIVNENDAKILIGKSGFCINKGFPVGKIHSISPVFICNTLDDKTNEFFFPANKEFQKYTKLKDDCTEEPHDDFFELKEVETGVFKLDYYDPKFPFDDFLINKDLVRIKYEDLFCEHRQVGIRKQYTGGADEKALYIQTFYKFRRLKPEDRKANYSFAFIVTLDESVKFAANNITSFGGEQQLFRMDVTPDFNEEFISLIPAYKPSAYFDKVVLVSDAYIETNEIFNTALFAITDTVDFRFLKTQTDQKESYYNKPTKSNKYNLLKRGSVFYGDIEKIPSCLINDIFVKLGYNIYKPIKKHNHGK